MNTHSAPILAREANRLARLAGATYVLLGVMSTMGFYHAPVIEMDPTALARGLAASDQRFGLRVVADMISAALAVPLALLLYQLFEPVNKSQARAMAVLLVVAVPISFVVALNYVSARWLLANSPLVSAIASAERNALGLLFVHLHVFGVLAVEIFWGLWMLPLGWLMIRSRRFPRLLGGLVLLAGAAYISHAVVTLIADGQRFALFERVTLVVRAAGELPTMVWLMVKGTTYARRDPG